MKTKLSERFLKESSFRHLYLTAPMNSSKALLATDPNTNEPLKSDAHMGSCPNLILNALQVVNYAILNFSFISTAG